MKRPRSNNTIIIFVLIIIIAGGIATLLQLHPWAKEPIEIIIPEVKAPISDSTELYIDGAVARPGRYPVDRDSTINDLLFLAGGLTDAADASEIKLHVPSQDEVNQPQRISINHADAWLLDALPGIGPTTAQRIIDYRETNGPFVTVYGLMLVPGIAESSFNNIKDLVTVE